MLRCCRVCPRDCQVNRWEHRTGVCKTGRHGRVSSAFPDLGEEDCLRGWKGSGTMFFSGCNLGCVFCQNYEISQLGAGPKGLRLPLVYNTGAYDSVETIPLLDGVVDIYMEPYTEPYKQFSYRNQTGREDSRPGGASRSTEEPEENKRLPLWRRPLSSLPPGGLLRHSGRSPQSNPGTAICSLALRFLVAARWAPSVLPSGEPGAAVWARISPKPSRGAGRRQSPPARCGHGEPTPGSAVPVRARLRLSISSCLVPSFPQLKSRPKPKPDKKLARRPGVVTCQHPREGQCCLFPRFGVRLPFAVIRTEVQFRLEFGAAFVLPRAVSGGSVFIC